MKIYTNQETVNAIKAITDQNTDKPSNIRLYIAGMGWSGPSFGLTLDELTDTDVKDDTNAVTFIMNKDVYEQIGDMLVELTNGGYLVRPMMQEESACGSCSGC